MSLTFFDTVDISLLLEEAVFTRFPFVILAYLIQQHVAPRVIQANGFSSEGITVFRSIIAGCKTSVALTRVCVKRALTILYNTYPESNPEVLVDDACMHAYSDTFDGALEMVIPSAVKFNDLVREMKLTLSPKACVAASSDKLAHVLKGELSTYNTVFQVDQEARDVGVTFAAGIERPYTLVKHRFVKARSRNTRIEHIARHSRFARKLFSGSAFSASTWGHQGTSISNSMMVELERRALAATGIKPAGRCRAISLIVAYGVQGTPRSRIVRESLRVWFDVLRNIKPSVLGDLRLAWAKARDLLIKEPKDIHVKGVMSNLILLLIKANWFPEQVHVWRDPRGTRWTLAGSLYSPDVVAAKINHDFLNIELQRADSHYCGSA